MNSLAQEFKYIEKISYLTLNKNIAFLSYTQT